MSRGKIKYWFTRNGVHIPVYENPMSKKIAKTLASSEGLNKRNPRTTQKDIFTSIDDLEKKANKVDLSESTIERYYKQAQKHEQTLKEHINTAHPLEDMDKLRQAQQRLDKIMKKLNNDYHNNQW